MTGNGNGRPRWAVDMGWTGTWDVPAVLSEPPDDVERRMLVELACSGIGPGRIARELAATGSIAEARERIRPPHDSRAALAVLERTGARAITPGDEEYPDILRAIDAPPPLLFVRGDRLDSLMPCVAIVGCRACSRGGARFAHRLASALAEAGFTVVSGLARGIDSNAHEGALEAGRSVAVLGTGIDRAYPPEHASLADWIASCGALVSEFPPGTGPRPWHFPARKGADKIDAYSARRLDGTQGGHLPADIGGCGWHRRGGEAPGGGLPGACGPVGLGCGRGLQGQRHVGLESEAAA